jgi:hypothetical protein
MADESFFKEKFDQFSDSIKEQVWFQQIKGKYEELDPQSRTYLLLGSVGGGSLIVFLVLLYSLFSVHGLKTDLSEKNELLGSLQGWNDEIRKLREINQGAGSAPAPTGTWADYLKSSAVTQGIDEANFAVGSQKSGANTEIAKEDEIEVAIKHSPIKSIVLYAHTLEAGTRPVKVRSLAISNKDAAGLADATYVLSAYTLIPNSK